MFYDLARRGIRRARLHRVRGYAGVPHGIAQSLGLCRSSARIAQSSGLCRSSARIAQSLGLCQSSARNCIQRTSEAGLSSPDVQDLDEGALERQLLCRVVCAEGHRFVMPDWGDVNRELKRSGVTLRLLWEGYRAYHPDDGHGYSASCQHSPRVGEAAVPFYAPAPCCGRETVCRLFRRAYGGDGSRDRHASSRCVVRRGVTPKACHANRRTVGATGASNYTLAEAGWSQTLPDWIGAHVRAFEFSGGSPASIVSDNLLRRGARMFPRAGRQPQLHRSCPPLSHGHPPGASLQAEG